MRLLAGKALYDSSLMESLSHGNLPDTLLLESSKLTYTSDKYFSSALFYVIMTAALQRSTLSSAESFVIGEKSYGTTSLGLNGSGTSLKYRVKRDVLTIGMLISITSLLLPFNNVRKTDKVHTSKLGEKEAPLVPGATIIQGPFLKLRPLYLTIPDDHPPLYIRRWSSL